MTQRIHTIYRVILLAGLTSVAAVCAQNPAPPTPTTVALPLDRTAYFIGETVPLAVTGTGDLKLEAVSAEGRILLYQGPTASLMLNTAPLMPGDYRLEVNGAPVLDRLTLTGVLRRSAGSMVDEVAPSDKMAGDDVVRIMSESGLTASLNWAVVGAGRLPYLDTLARTGALGLVNPDTRPTSFFPVGNEPAELDGMSQRMILTAQANGRYPNFGGFCFGWDAAGFALGGRLGLLTYWGWADQTQALRNYIARGVHAPHRTQAR